MDNQNNIQQQQDSFKGRGALDAFLNLLSLVTLGWFSISLGGLLFQIINKFFSNPAFSFTSRFSTSNLKFHIASLLIITPVFILIISTLHKHYKNRRLNPQSGVYRWLTYLMLFIAACNIIGSLIALVFKLLDGEYTSGTLLKIGVVFVIASGVFGYYWYDLKRKDYSAISNISKIGMAVMIVFSVASIIGGIVIAGSPKTSRLINFDMQRRRNLSQMKTQIENYFRQNEKLPEDLSDQRFSSYNDPETGEPYEYQVVSDIEYELCATFSLSAQEGVVDEFYPEQDDWFYHKPGRQCFQQSVKNIMDKGVIRPVPVR